MQPHVSPPILRCGASAFRAGWVRAQGCGGLSRERAPDARRCVPGIIAGSCAGFAPKACCRSCLRGSRLTAGSFTRPGRANQRAPSGGAMSRRRTAGPPTARCNGRPSRAPPFVHGASQPGVWDREPEEESFRRAGPGAGLDAGGTPGRPGSAGLLSGTAADAWRSAMRRYRPLRSPTGGCCCSPVQYRRSDVAVRGLVQSPSMWWPETGPWCVETEVDGMSTYVGGTERQSHRRTRRPQ